MLSVGMVVVSYGSARWLPECFDSLLEAVAAYPGPTRLALVENNPDPAVLKATRQAITPYLARGVEYWPAPTNLGYGGGANWGWEQLGPTDLQIVLNPDMRFRADWLRAFVKPFERDLKIGIVGCKLLTGEGLIQHAGGILGRGSALGLHFGYGEPDDGRWDEAGAVEFVTGAALGIRSDLNRQLGSFDPAFFPGYYEDVDLCWRARQAGYTVWYEAGAVAWHYEGAAFGRGYDYYRVSHRNRLRFVLKNFGSRRLLQEFLPTERLRLRGQLDQYDRRASANLYRLAARSFVARLENKEKIPPLKPSPLDDNNFDFNPSDQTSAAQAERLTAHLGEVKAGWLVEEKPFRSRLPFVARLRERFNSISTRWYVQPILAQQVEFNAAVARALEDLGRLTLGQESASEMQTTVLAQRLLDLENRLSRIEILLEKLTQNS